MTLKKLGIVPTTAAKQPSTSEPGLLQDQYRNTYHEGPHDVKANGFFKSNFGIYLGIRLRLVSDASGIQCNPFSQWSS